MCIGWSRSSLEGGRVRGAATGQVRLEGLLFLTAGGAISRHETWRLFVRFCITYLTKPDLPKMAFPIGYSDARVGIGMLVGPSEGCPERWLIG